MVDLKREVDDLKHELSQLRENMGDLVSIVKDLGKGDFASTAKDMGQSAIHTTRNKAEQELDQLLSQLTRAYASARKTGGEVAETAYSEIKQHPALASLAAIFVIGLIAGKIFSQR
jgi:ElaB/YqjD/DUF883 family membrane-anchored ribosome-binding protein